MTEATALSIPSRATLTERGMELPTNLTYEEWLGTMGKLFQLERATQWFIGDGLAYGNRQYGERYAQALALSEATGMNVDTLRSMQWVAEQIPPERRRPALSWTHHRYVSGQEPEVQERLLATAEEQGWPSARLQEAVRTYKKALEAPEEYPDDEPEDVARATNEDGPALEVDEEQTFTPAPHGMTPEEVEKWGLPEEMVPEVDPYEELREANKIITAREEEIESLSKDDKGAEIRKLHARIAALEGRLRGESNAKNEAIKLTEYYQRLVRDLKKALGVEENSEIKPKILQLLQRS